MVNPLNIILPFLFTTLNRAEAVCYIRDLIEDKIKKGMSADDAVRRAFAYVTETYLTRPLGVFDKRQEVRIEDGDAL